MGTFIPIINILKYAIKHSINHNIIKPSNFSVNPLISSLGRDILFWWGREGCGVRRWEEGNEKKERGIEKEEKELLDFRCSQENKKSEKTFGAQKKTREVENWGGHMYG